MLCTKFWPCDCVLDVGGRAVEVVEAIVARGSLVEVWKEIVGDRILVRPGGTGAPVQVAYEEIYVRSEIWCSNLFYSGVCCYDPVVTD